MSDPPVVLHLITRWLRGGAEAKTFAEMEGLRDRYTYVLAHGEAADSVMSARVDEAGFSRRPLPRLRHFDPLAAPGAVADIRRLLRDVRPDLLHVHSTEAGVVGRIAAKREGVPVVATLHGLPFRGSRSAPFRAAIVLAERLLAARTSLFLANSPAIRDAYISAGIGRPKQYRVVVSGIDLTRVRAAAPADLPGRRPCVLFAGRLEANKGILDAVEAVRRLRRSGFDVDLLVAGDGPLRARLPREAWLHVLGHRDDLPSVLRSVDVIVLPSVAEGTPRVLTEAMACGVPVVATAVGGIPEQVGAAGILVAPRDADALVEGLRTAVGDAAARAAMLAAVAERADAFSLEAMLRATDAAYREILSA